MNLDELQSVRDRERQTDKLQQLRDSFYADAGELIQQLRTERERAAERADDPFDAPEVNRLTDEIKTAEQTVEAIYEKRVGKVVKAASFAAADLPAESDGMTTEEQELFDTLVGDIKENRSYVLDVLAGEDDSPATGTTVESQSPAPSTQGSPTPTEAGRSGAPTEHSTEAPPQTDPTEAQTSGQPGSPAGQSEPPAETGVSAADVMGGGSDEAAESQPTPPADVPPDQAVDDRRDTESEMGTPPHEVESTGQAASDVADQTTPPAEEQTTTIGESVTAHEQTPQSEYPVRKDGGTGAQAAEGGSQTGIDRRTVRITESVDTFVGSDDRDYDLDRNDVVTLPSTNAELLVERDVAEQID
jgi:DNA replication factor GINS